MASWTFSKDEIDRIETAKTVRSWREIQSSECYNCGGRTWYEIVFYDGYAYWMAILEDGRLPLNEYKVELKNVTDNTETEVVYYRW